MRLIESQVSHIVGNVTRKNLKTCVAELQQIVQRYGPDIHIHLVRCLFSVINIADNKGGKDQLFQTQILAQELSALCRTDYLSSALCIILESPDHHSKGKFPTYFFPLLARLVKLSTIDELQIALAAAKSGKHDVASCARTFAKGKFADVIAQCDATLPLKTLQQIVLYIRSGEAVTLGISPDQCETYLKMLCQRLQDKDAKMLLLPLILGPMEFSYGQLDDLPDGMPLAQIRQTVGNTHESLQLAAIMRESGYSCCSSVSSVADVLKQLPRDRLTSSAVARVLGMMNASLGGLEDGVAIQTMHVDGSGAAWEKKSDGSAKDASTWQVINFIDAIKSHVSDMSWRSVIDELDHPGFEVHGMPGFLLILGAYARATKAPFPIDLVFSKQWRNQRGQLSFMRVLADPAHAKNADVVALISLPTHRLSREGLKNTNSSSDAMLQLWTSLDFITTAMRLGENGFYSEVMALLEPCVAAYPDVLALGLAMTCPGPWFAVQRDIANKVLPLFLEPGPNASFVLSKFFQHKQEVVLQSILAWYAADATPQRLVRVLDIAQDTKALTQLLQVPEPSFVLDLAVMASHRGFLNLDKWFETQVAEQASFVTAGFFLEASVTVAEKLLEGSMGATGASKIHTSALTIIHTLSTLPREALGRVLAEKVARLSDRVRGQRGGSPGTDPTTGADTAGDSGGAGGSTAGGGDTAGADVSELSFARTIDEEANSYFASLYSGEKSIEEVVALLNAFKVSKEQKDQDVFACMIRNLFDEYRFFPQYPDNELGITGILFGILVQDELVSLGALSKALKYVLEALRKSPTSKMHRFGICALSKFKTQLAKWPQYCTMICQIPHFQTFPADLIAICTAGATVGGAASDGAAGTTPASDVVRPTLSGSKPSFGSSNTNMLVSAAAKSTHREPSLAIQDKIHFVFNNIAAGNLGAKARELNQAVTPSFYGWMAQYLVVKRCSIEPNNHALYLDFMHQLRLPVFDQAVLRETLRNVRLLLKSTRIADAANSSERALLKNLGSWLGKQTLARNKPILYRDLAVKELVLYAYELGVANLMYIIPFVSRVLEACRDSAVFRPPNPWTMGVMAVLKELHQLPDLRLNLKFEVELLCKNLNIELDGFTASQVLGNIRPGAAAAEGVVVGTGSPAVLGGSDSRGGGGAGSAGEHAHQLSPRLHFPDIVANKIGSIAQYIAINPSIALFQQHPDLKGKVQVAVEGAIEEIINPIVDRSVKIACISAQKLIVKDFALEPDEGKLRAAAHHLVGHLAGSLAMVTAKDPLRLSIGSHLRNHLLNALAMDQKSPPQQVALLEQVSVDVCADNLALACTFIEKTAMARALPEVDELLSDAYLQRLKFREMQSGSSQPFHDAKNYSAGASALPVQLRPKFGGLDEHQYALYQNFAVGLSGSSVPLVGSGSGSPSSTAMPSIKAQHSPLVAYADPSKAVHSPAQDQRHPQQQQQQQQPQPQPQPQQTMHDTMLIALEKATEQSPHTELTSLKPQHDVHSVLRDIQRYVAQVSPRVELVAVLLQKLLLRLLDVDASEMVLLHDACMAVVVHLIDVHRSAAAVELTTAYAYVQGERKFNADAVARLVRAGVFDMAQLDAHFVKAMEGGHNFRMVLLVEDVLRRCFLTDNSSAAPSTAPTVLDFAQTLDFLERMAQHASPVRDQQVALVDGLARLRQTARQPQTTTAHPPPPGDGLLPRPETGHDADPPGLRDQVRYLFEEWLQLVHEPARDKAGMIFVTRLMQRGMLRTDDISTRFFRLCADHAVSLCVPDGGEGDVAVRYHGVDAFAKLIVVLLTHFGESTKVALLNKVLKTIIALLLRDHERLGIRFNQKPYFRLLCSLLFDVHATDEAIGFQVLTGFTHAFHLLRPSVVPGFSFAWLELVSHRNFMPKLLLMKDTKGWQMLQRLLIDLFDYMAPFLDGGKMNDAVRLLYKGTLRMLLVLLHDFPEFLAGYHFALCDAIPIGCIQLRNLVLSAFPRNMRLPDPFTPNLKIDLLPEIAQPPRFLSSYAGALEGSALCDDVDNYFRRGPGPTFLTQLPTRFYNVVDVDGEQQHRYNLKVINAFVLYVGVKGMEDKSGGPVATGPAADIYTALASAFNVEGRYLLVNAIANQLRYPNAHTHYFSCVLLHMFAEADKEVTREQITRVLLERLIVNRPHPWGLLITFVELIQNRAYNFWSHSFVHCGEAHHNNRKLQDSVQHALQISCQRQERTHLQH